jgi:hypothetical protein
VNQMALTGVFTLPFVNPLNVMKRHFIFDLILFFGLSILPFLANAQSAKSSKPSGSAIENLAQKRTQRMKDELFLSNEQYGQILDINKEMLIRLNKIESQNLDHAEMNKQITGLDNWAKNKIVPILTPAQRERFESALFAKIYETKVDTKKAITQARKK